MGQNYKTIAISGASSGLGAALAEKFAAPGVHLFICARRTDLLARVAEKCRQNGATVSYEHVDFQFPKLIDRWISQIDSDRPVDLMILNSGIFDGNTASDQLEPTEIITSILSTNLAGSIVAASAMATRMQARKHGRIALISSLAAFYPLADAPAYSASKAGLTAYGTALREYLLPYNVGLSLIHPGHLKTAQTEIQIGKLPAIMSAEHAAVKIAKALISGRSTVSFPRKLRLIIALNNLLPLKIRAVFNRPFRFVIKK